MALRPRCYMSYVLIQWASLSRMTWEIMERFDLFFRVVYKSFEIALFFKTASSTFHIATATNLQLSPLRG